MNADQQWRAHDAACDTDLLLEEVAAMRAAQVKYFKTRERQHLIESKDHEAVVDEALRLMKEKT